MNICSNTPECVYSFKSKLIDISTFPSYVDCKFCNQISYCSDICRIKHWENHKFACAGFINEESPTNNKNMNLIDFEFILNPSNRKHIVLGKGAFADVKLIKEKSTKKLYALKTLKKSLLKNSKSTKNLKREIKCQRELNHPNILKLDHFFEDDDQIYLILELAEKGSLFRYLKNNNQLSEPLTFYFFFQITLAIDYMHKNNIIHRDIKPENILLNRYFKAKVSDFGFATEIKDNRSSLCGTIDYLCPEILKKESYDNKIDIWCLGVLLYELCAGYPPFYAKDPKEKVQNILNMKWEFPKNISFSPELKNLINLLLQEQPKNRPEISEIFEHSWMLMHYSLYNMDKEEALYLSFNRLFNKNNDLCSISNDQNESLYLKESILTSEYLKINGIEDLLHLNLKNIKQNNPCNYDQKFAKLKKSNKSSGSSESNLSYRNASYRNLRTDSPINKYKSNSPNKNVFTFEDKKSNRIINNPIKEEDICIESIKALAHEDMNDNNNGNCNIQKKNEETIKINKSQQKIVMNSGIKENLFETEDLSSIEIKKEKYIEKTENSSFDFIEKREQIMKKFQNNFIHIYEGNPIETEYIPANFSPKTKNKTTEESLKQNKLKISLEHLISEENKENREKLKKKEKFKKIMNEIEKKNRKKFEIMQSKNKKTIQRDCFSSKIIEKNEKELSFWEKVLIKFGCLINKKENGIF